jgi:hypothetical protein
MQRKQQTEPSLEYLNNKPLKLKWKVIAGPPGVELSKYQEYDLIYDKRDLEIRKLDTTENLESLRKRDERKSK